MNSCEFPVPHSLPNQSGSSRNAFSAFLLQSSRDFSRHPVRAEPRGSNAVLSSRRKPLTSVQETQTSSSLAWNRTRFLSTKEKTKMLASCHGDIELKNACFSPNFWTAKKDCIRFKGRFCGDRCSHLVPNLSPQTAQEKRKINDRTHYNSGIVISKFCSFFQIRNFRAYLIPANREFKNPRRLRRG